MDKAGYKRARIFAPYHDLDLDDFEELSSNKVALDLTIRWIESEKSDPRGICYVGPPGVGKTFLAMCCAKRAVEEGMSVHCMQLAQYIEMQRRYISLEGMRDHPEVAEEWWGYYRDFQNLRAKTQVVVVDD